MNVDEIEILILAFELLTDSNNSLATVITEEVISSILFLPCYFAARSAMKSFRKNPMANGAHRDYNIFKVYF